jgi:hypothetical protein
VPAEACRSARPSEGRGAGCGVGGLEGSVHPARPALERAGGRRCQDEGRVALCCVWRLGGCCGAAPGQARHGHKRKCFVSVCLSVCLSYEASVLFLSDCLSACLWACLSVSLSVYLPVWLLKRSHKPNPACNADFVHLSAVEACLPICMLPCVRRLDNPSRKHFIPGSDHDIKQSFD